MRRARPGRCVLLLAALLTWTRPGSALDVGGTAEGGVGVYADSDDTTVVSPHVSVSLEDESGWTASAAWVADVITSASVDVVTQATPGFRELRQEATLGGGWRRPDRGFNAGVTYSHERDTHADIAYGGGNRRWRGNLETSLRYSFSLTAMGRATQRPELWRDVVVHGVEAGLLQPLGPLATAELILSTYYSTGYHANPYRRVPVVVSGSLSDAVWHDERMPDTRWRYAATGRLRRAFGTRLFTSIEYRFYRDSWNLLAHTAEVRLAWAPSDPWRVELRDRVHVQGASAHYRERYAVQLAYMTRDRRQSPFLSNMGGLAITHSWRRVFHIDRISARASADLFDTEFDHYFRPGPNRSLVPLGRIWGAVGQVNVEADF